MRSKNGARYHALDLMVLLEGGYAGRDAPALLPLF